MYSLLSISKSVLSEMMNQVQARMKARARPNKVYLTPKGRKNNQQLYLFKECVKLPALRNQRQNVTALEKLQVKPTSVPASNSSVVAQRVQHQTARVEARASRELDEIDFALEHVAKVKRASTAKVYKQALTHWKVID